MAAPALNRAGRQARIVELIRDQAVHSQAELLGLLVAEGTETTQATVSRDLDELGAIKVRGAYVIPDDGSPVRGVEGGTSDDRGGGLGLGLLVVAHPPNLGTSTDVCEGAA